MDKPGNWTLETTLPVRFVIKNSPNLLDVGNNDLLEFGNNPGRRLVILDHNVYKLYKSSIVAYFDSKDIDYHFVAIDSQENTKNLKALISILKEMEQFGLVRRNEPVIAIGGGVLLDIVGLAASLYRRGVPYIRVPTTLVGLVDASVGAKTGINFEDRRNRLGTYYPPIASYLNKNFLSTLASIEISSGLGEILKMAVVKDLDLFKLLSAHGAELLETKFMNSDAANDIINLATKGMKDELQENLWEKNLERYVDFGHSFSPIIEMRSIHDEKYKSLTHGHAVGLDVIYSCILSVNRGLLSMDELRAVFRAAKSMEIPVYHDLFSQPTMVLEALQDTVKHRNGNQNLPIPTTIGNSIFINDLEYAEIKMACEMFGSITLGMGADK